MKKFMMSEEAFNELINGFEYVGNLTEYGKENIKYHVQILQQKNKKLEQALDEIEKYLKSNIESCNSALSNPEYTIISKHELLKNEKQKDIDILKIIQKAKGDGK